MCLIYNAPVYCMTVTVFNCVSIVWCCRQWYFGNFSAFFGISLRRCFGFNCWHFGGIFCGSSRQCRFIYLLRRYFGFLFHSLHVWHFGGMFLRHLRHCVVIFGFILMSFHWRDLLHFWHIDLSGLTWIKQKTFRGLTLVLCCYSCSSYSITISLDD